MEWSGQEARFGDPKGYHGGGVPINKNRGGAAICRIPLGGGKALNFRGLEANRSTEDTE